MLTRCCFVGAIVLLVACGKRSEPFDAGLVTELDAGVTTNLDASVPDGGVARFQGLRLDQMLGARRYHLFAPARSPTPG
jgi:hypothetical protein